MKSVHGEDNRDEISSVCNFYGEDFDESLLELQLETLHATIPEELKLLTSSFQDMKYLKSMSVAEKSHISEVITHLKLILVLPSTNAASERSFSAMRRLKTYLRATMNQQRMNNLLVLLVH